jgi:hypothetical protein
LYYIGCPEKRRNFLDFGRRLSKKRIKRRKERKMTNKDFERIENRLLAIVEQSAPEDACNAAKTLVDMFCQTEELKLRKDQYAAHLIESAGKIDKPAPEGVIISQYANNELIVKLVKSINSEELVNPLAKNSEAYNKAWFAAVSRTVEGASRPHLMEAAIVEDHYMALIAGGNNGNGKWTEYCQQLQNIFTVFKEEGYDAWLVNLENDCPDDIWYAYIAFRKQQA